VRASFTVTVTDDNAAKVREVAKGLAMLMRSVGADQESVKSAYVHVSDVSESLSLTPSK